MSQALTHKHRPKSLDDVYGHPSAVSDLKDWIEDWTPGTEAVLLHGPPGTGKSSTIEAMANDYDLRLVEINASDSRRKDDVEDIARQIATGSPDGDPSEIIMVDEADSLSSTAPLAEALKDPQKPVAVICNDEYELSNSISNKCDDYKFNLGKRSIKSAIEKIAEKEGIELTNRQIGQLGTRNGLREAIHDLQQYAAGNNEIGFDDRDMEVNGFTASRNIIEEKKYTGSELMPPDLVLWLDENLSGRLEGLEQAMAYDALSRADKWTGRAHSTGNYSYWAYTAELAEQCANLRLTEPYDGYINVNFPTWFRSRNDNYRSDNKTVKLYKALKRIDDGLFEFGGDYTYFREVLLPFIEAQDDEDLYKFIHHYGLGEDEVSALSVSYSDYEDWKESGDYADRDAVEEEREQMQEEVDSYTKMEVEDDEEDEEEDQGKTVLDF